MVRRNLRRTASSTWTASWSPSEHRRKGIATAVYRAVERSAKPFDRLVCGIRSDPPDVAGLAFHAGRDFVEVGKLRRPDGTTTALCAKELTD